MNNKFVHVRIDSMKSIESFISKTISSDSHLAKVYFGLDRTIIASAHGSTAFEAKSKAADRAMIVLTNRTKQIDTKSLKMNETSSMVSSIFDQPCQLVMDFIQSNRNQPIFQTLNNRFYDAFIIKKGR